MAWGEKKKLLLSINKCPFITFNFNYLQDPSDTSEPVQKKQKCSSNVSIGKLKNKTQLASLVKVKKDKTNGQKVAEKVDTASPVTSVKSQDSSIDTDGSNTKTDAGPTNGLGSLGMLGDYSSSEDSDEQTWWTTVNHFLRGYTCAIFCISIN